MIPCVRQLCVRQLTFDCTNFLSSNDTDCTRFFVPNVQGFAKSLLDVADNRERAAEAVPENKLQEAAQDPEKLKALLQSLLQGVKMTQSTLNQVPKQCGCLQHGWEQNVYRYCYGTFSWHAVCRGC